MDRGIAWLFVCVFITSFSPSANAQSPQVSRKIWCTLSPNTITGNANETYNVTLSLYTNYQTKLFWSLTGQGGSGWESWYIHVYGSPAQGAVVSANSSVALQVILPSAIGTHTCTLTVHDFNDPNWTNYTMLTVNVLPQIPGVDFSLIINPKNIYFDLSKIVGTTPATGQIYCTSSHAFYLNVTNNVSGLIINYPSTCGSTSPSNPAMLIDIRFNVDPSKVQNGTYPIEFIAYTNSTNSLSIKVLIHIRAMISKVWISPQSPLWGEDVTVFANMTRGMNIKWARLLYSIDKGDSWKTVNMGIYTPEANLYAGSIPSQMVGTEALYYVEASDGSGNVEIYPTQTYAVGMPVWVNALAVTFLIAMTAVIIVIRRRRAPGQPPPPPASTPPAPPLPPPPPPSEQGIYKSQFHCNSCGRSFWVYEHRLKIPYCCECGAPNPVFIATAEQ